MTTLCLAPLCLKMYAAARPSFIAISVVMGCTFAVPRTPSVPKSLRMDSPRLFPCLSESDGHLHAVLVEHDALLARRLERDRPVEALGHAVDVYRLGGDIVAPPDEALRPLE